MIRTKLFKANIKQLKNIRWTIICCSIILSVLCFICRDFLGLFWIDYILFLLPYISATSYSYCKNRLLKNAPLFLTDPQKIPTLPECVLNINESLQILIKLI